MPSSQLGGFGRDPDEIEHRIDQWAQGFAVKAERYRAAQEQTEQIRSTASSRDGSVRVTVRADGSVTDLVFTEKVRSLPLTELSAQILATMRSAQARIADQVGAVMTAQLGDEDAQTRAVMLDNLRERFPVPPDEQVEPAPASKKWNFADAEPDDQAPQPPPAAPPPPSARPPTPGRARPRPDDGEDDDFDPQRDWRR